MPALLPNIDPDGLLEYSVVYTDRALNHMSQSFQGVMRDISGMLKEVYHAHSAIVVPGSGTFGMEAVARQFATRRDCLVIRNGWFSYRWTQIFEMGDIPSSCQVIKARRIEDRHQPHRWHLDPDQVQQESTLAAVHLPRNYRRRRQGDREKHYDHRRYLRHHH